MNTIFSFFVTVRSLFDRFGVISSEISQQRIDSDGFFRFKIKLPSRHKLSVKKPK